MGVASSEDTSPQQQEAAKTAGLVLANYLAVDDNGTTADIVSSQQIGSKPAGEQQDGALSILSKLRFVHGTDGADEEEEVLDGLHPAKSMTMERNMMVTGNRTIVMASSIFSYLDLHLFFPPCLFLGSVRLYNVLNRFP